MNNVNIKHLVSLLRKPRASHGFNLVEVALAVAIVGATIAILLGLFPMGLQASREAQDQTIAATIAMDILNTLQAAGASSFTNASMARFGTVDTSAAIYYSNAGVIKNTGTCIFNLQTITAGMPGDLVQPFLLFFTARGAQTTNTGTTTLNPNWSMLRAPYFRAELTILQSNSITPYVSPMLARAVLQMRWPCFSNPGSYSGWRPRRGGPSSTGTFTDRTVTYFTEIAPLR